ncbi:sugar transferase [Pseudoalteromonas tunicata]|uniref:sugar transferase n=1 Tax=Pseudoalteromonas tunicata TaxID=314281 RepID=UPI00273FF667|nr:sugar transferase [Pseudoalteromonas tunicata]MDP5212904.1 sugar transferase [Pseudoalteromonas tunicata]
MNLMLSVLIFLTVVFIYHHFIYPYLLGFFAKRKPSMSSSADNAHYPRIGIMICAHNEEAFISQKLFNLSAMEYPIEKYEIQIVLDGCTDETKLRAEQAISQLHQQHICAEIHEFTNNQGKVAALNHLINTHKDQYDVLVFTDVSALMSIDALTRIAHHFADEKIAVVSGIYQFYDSSLSQEKYWQYQNKLKLAESNYGAVVGVPGAMCAIRSAHVKPLFSHAINDDFILAMQALCEGHHAVIDAHLNIIEMERDQEGVDFARRVRIAAGNFQQIYLLKHLTKSANPWLLFNFVSHKVLRGLMPLVVMCGVVTLMAAAILENHFFAQACLLILFASVSIGAMKKWFAIEEPCAPFDQINYVLASYAAGCMGIAKYCTGGFNMPWRRVEQTNSSTTKNSGKQGTTVQSNTTNQSAFNVIRFKRVMDIVGATIGLVLASPIMIAAMVAIKLDSKGPVFYQQLRVGQADDDFVELFQVYKFRSMFTDAELQSGAVWASKGDPRITRVGRFLRKTRIDELPQFINVLKGEMSLIGPRPERPVFYGKLEDNIPYFSLRTYGIKPGISGLAQVMNGYDENIEDVRSKIGWDYAYALALSSPKQWLSMEWMIILKTIRIVVLGKGQ